MKHTKNIDEYFEYLLYRVNSSYSFSYSFFFLWSKYSYPLFICYSLLVRLLTTTALFLISSSPFYSVLLCCSSLLLHLLCFVVFLRLLHSTLLLISSSSFRFCSVLHLLSECVKRRSVIIASDRNTTVLRPLSTATSVNQILSTKSGYYRCSLFCI